MSSVIGKSDRATGGQLRGLGGVDGNQMSGKGAAVENGLDRKAEMRHHLRFQNVSLSSIRQTS